MARRTESDRVTITLDETHGAERLDALRHDLVSARAAGTAVVVDLSDVDVLDSALLAAILVAATASEEHGTPLSVVASPRVYHGLTEWRFDTILSISEADVTP